MCLGISGRLAIGDGAHDLHLVVEVEEEEVEDGDGHHNNMRGDAQSIGTTASLWSGRWTGRSAQSYMLQNLQDLYNQAKLPPEAFRGL